MTNFEHVRATEFSRLDKGDHVYLDYTGAGLHPKSLIENHISSLNEEVLGNPHSDNPTSKLATEHVKHTRLHILHFFNADPREYEVIFTPNASGALKIVGESYPFRRNSTYAMLTDNHNSVHGIREFATAAGANVTYLPLDKELRAHSPEAVGKVLKARTKNVPNLFAYPAQSNFSGVKHSLHLVSLAQYLGYDVFLDTAAYVPTNSLDLSSVKPEFLAISFYKMFGFPTGIGALLVRKKALKRLNRPWFAGGTVRFVSVQNKMHLLHDDYESFEDGTVNFLLIPAISRGLKFLENLGMDYVKNHVSSMTKLVLSGLNCLSHSTGKSIIDLYGPNNMHMRGGTVTFNVVAKDGTKIDPRIVEKEANKNTISLRTGCFCNPGAAETAFELSAAAAMKCFVKIGADEFSLDKFSHCMRDPRFGAVRVSVGIATNKSDVDKLITFMSSFIDYEHTTRSSKQDTRTSKPFGYERRKQQAVQRKLGRPKPTGRAWSLLSGKQ